MKKILATALITALTASMALTGCGGGTDGGSGDGDASKGGDTIKIGVNYELTGEVATYGQSSVDGIEMAIEEVNGAGGINGKQIELVKIDNKSDPSEVTSVATKMVTQNGVCMILGPATSGNFIAQGSVAEQNGIPIISASATADNVTADLDKEGNVKKVKDHVFRLCFSDSYQGSAMANFASKTLNAKTAAVIMDSSSDYAKGLNKNFQKTFGNNGGTITDTQAYVAKDKDFNAILTKLKGQQFDVIFLPGYYQEAGLIIKQARALGITAPILGADGFDSPTLLELAGASALNDVYYTNHYSSLDKDPAVLKFIEDFKTKYGKDPDAFNALGYDLGKFAADAVKRAGSEDPAAITKALAETKDFPAVTGTLSIDENHNPVKAIVVIKLTDGVQSESNKVEM